MLPIIQCLKTCVSYIVSSCLVVYGGNASALPVHPSWATWPKINFAGVTELLNFVQLSGVPSSK